MALKRAADQPSLDCKLETSAHGRNCDDVIKIADGLGESLEISLQRTIRVPDGDGDSELPPSMGTFPLYSVASYADRLPTSITLKGGLFFPMYRKSFRDPSQCEMGLMKRRT